jgi:lysophospholipase L1-like esterase
MLAKRVAVAVGALGAATAGTVGYTVARVQGRARGDVSDFLAGPVASAPPVVVAGASIVRGKASVDFVQVLRERFPSRSFVNAGVNGNVAWELLQRLGPIVACRPSHVVMLVGTNDVQATLSVDAMRETRESKGLPEDPSLGWFAACLDDIVERLHDAGAAVAICSLPPIGQDLDAPVNVVVREANAEIARVCGQRGATYLPVYENLTELLASQHATTGPAWTGSWLPGARSLIEHFVLRRSYDSIALAQGWVLSPDGVHMDSTGAAIIADTVSAWLDG